MATEKLWTGFDNTKIMAERAVCDEVGQNIVDTYAKSADLSNKVDKVEGKGLSENDYTDADKAKVDAIGAWTSGQYPAPYDLIIGGRKYNYVQIGNQLWMAENLAYEFDGCTIGESISTTECRANYYNNNKATYGANGLYYNYTATLYLEANKDTLLPDGWHVPSASDFDTLILYAGGTNVAGKKLKATTGWRYDYAQGTDDYGFSAKPCGMRLTSGSFSDLTIRYYMSSSTVTDGYLTYYEVNASVSDATKCNKMSVYNNGWQISIRLVKNIQ